MRYLKVLGIFYKAAILTDLEYRANFVTNVLMSIVAALATLLTMGIFFEHTTTLGGWSFYEALVVVDCSRCFWDWSIHSSRPTRVHRASALGHDGFILTKPLNSQFHASLRRCNVALD
jgi:ABC-2 type transport system permease protein